MKISLYSKIAVDNLRNNLKLYIPRILAEIGLLGCFYITFALALDERLANVRGGAYVVFFMQMGTAVLGGLSLILILYINSFLMKRRKSEYGLYNVLGMEKRHIVKVLFSESFYASLVSVIMGIGLGVLFYKLFSIIICRLLQIGVIAGFYYINVKTILLPAIVFVIFDIFAFALNSISVFKLKPIELISEKNKGEKEPKVKWLILIIGVLTLATGYTMSITVKNSISALFLFFPAVILVIIGTYCLFITGTTFVLKCLKRNSNYYYNKNHMPVISGLLFRMKKNAVGLASIAILATGVLVMLSTTVSLYNGMQETLDMNYPQHLYLSAGYEENGKMIQIPSTQLEKILIESSDENNIKISNIDTQQYLSAAYLLRGNKLLTKSQVKGEWNINEITNVTYITENTYRKLHNNKKSEYKKDNNNLSKNEIIYCRISSDLDNMVNSPDSLIINNKEYKVKETVLYFPVKVNTGNIVNSVGIVVSDDDVLNEIYIAQKESYGENASEYTDRIAVTFENEEAAIETGMKLEDTITDKINKYYDSKKVEYVFDSKWNSKENLLGMYASFLLLGILVGFVCLLSTILIIYYKQISEGYEDRNRFQIMQKIGMDKSEVKKTIKNQLILQFFLPLITAGIHTAASFPMLLKIMKLLLLSNTALFVICSIITYVLFTVVYIAVYLITSGTYYKIVN